MSCRVGVIAKPVCGATAVSHHQPIDGILCFSVAAAFIHKLSGQYRFASRFEENGFRRLGLRRVHHDADDFGEHRRVRAIQRRSTKDFQRERKCFVLIPRAANKRNSSRSQEYLLADRSMPILPVSFSLMASFISSITLLGVSNEIYQYGTQFIVINVSYGNMSLADVGFTTPQIIFALFQA